MLAPVRAGFFAALAILASVFLRSRPRRRQSLPARRSRRSRDQARSPDQDATPARSTKPVAQLAPRGRRRVPEERLPRRHGAARADRRGRAATRAPTGCGWRAPSCRSGRPNERERTTLLERAATAAYIAYQRAGNRSEEADSLVDHRPQLRATAGSGGRRSTRCGFRSNCARSPTCARTTSSCARSTASACSTTRSMPTPPRRAPASSSPRSCPGKRTDFSPFVAVAGHRQAGALGRGEAALRRGPEARRALRRHAARRAAVDASRRRCRSRADFTIYVRDRKPLVRFTGQGLCAAAHRPARHSARQRQHRCGRGRDLPRSATAT